ncbi:50S ribosomal protein L16 [candidate division WWE3 bacterium CG_4_10_14_0_2_um_filter_42_7]|uniref:Large ribosomal subunit protein uL16 n=2 Tax=Katanobacteria TaxID=422282 RepID=A0A2H0X8W7_UNCKA|nr:MAG: 50S ribosomal protein L16 [candidate division WWE3 bacterium CG08_land_8_20_14_0_20_41_15]PIZ42944.1 MAG: 50S ribosomal protein L16 [candidate division WWE3 bacterium CG_4_10_14_0_2_um_filter_42_7]
MLGPKRTKFRFRHKGRIAGKSPKGSSMEFGEYGLKAMQMGLLSATQIEAARKVIMHTTKRSGKLWIRVFPDKPMTLKGAGVRMGGGKGDFKNYSAVIRPGKLIFEIAGVSKEMACEALRKASIRLPIEARIIYPE